MELNQHVHTMCAQNWFEGTFASRDVIHTLAGLSLAPRTVMYLGAQLLGRDGRGLESTPDNPWCSYCGKPWDIQGAHFAKCQGEGATTSGHTPVKEVALQIARDAGLHAFK